MNGSDLAAAAAGGILVMLVVVALVAAGITLAVVFGFPWLWEIVRPWLHGVTA